MRTTFSIVIPVHGDRDGRRPITSVYGQQYPRNLYEVIIVEDDNARSFVPNGMPNFKIATHHDQRLERAISRTEGMEEAKKDWIIWLDSDDELVSTTLYNLDYWIRKCPEYKLFHWGGIVYWEAKTWDEKDYEPRTTIRPTPDLPDGDPGMGFFPTGLVAAGHFCLRRELFMELGGLPKETSPYEFADRGAEEFPELRKMMEERGVDTLGNPWGDDFLYYYKLTRKYKSKGLPLHLYIQHVRR